MQLQGTMRLLLPTSLLQLKKAYKEIYRVLKPGGKFVSYEWITLPGYDPNNEEHAHIIQEINLRNGLPVRMAHQLRVTGG